MLVSKPICFGSVKLAARWLNCGILQIGVPRNSYMHISGAAPIEEKEDDENNDAGRQDEVEIFTYGVAVKNNSFNEVGLCRWIGIELASVEISGHCGQTLFSFSTHKNWAQPCCKEYFPFSVAAV